MSYLTPEILDTIKHVVFVIGMCFIAWVYIKALS